MLPSASAASTAPAAASAPCAFANAGTATSRTPNMAPIGTSTATSARIPALAIAPKPPTARRSPRQARDAGVAANASTPISSAIARPTTAAAGEPSAISAAAASGPPMKKTSSSTACSA